MRIPSPVLLLGTTLLIAVAGCEDDASGPEMGTTFTVALSGLNERPNPISPAGSGTATFTLNDAETILDYQLSVENMTSEITAAHIHLGNADVAGGIIAPLSTPVNGGTVAGRLQPDMALGLGLSWESLLALIKNGDVYVNVHTTTNPGGETRGQVEEMP